MTALLAVDAAAGARMGDPSLVILCNEPGSWLPGDRDNLFCTPFQKTNGWKVGRMGVAVSWIEVMSNLEAGTAVESGPADAAF